MTKCEVINLTPIVALIAISSKRHAISVHTVSLFLYKVFVHITSSSCYNGNYFTGLMHVVVIYCSLVKSGGLICIA